MSNILNAETYGGAFDAARFFCLPERDTERFWALVDRSGGHGACWPWQGVKTNGGYGSFRPERAERTYPASRLAWMLTHYQRLGRWEFVLHRCDNPPCCNPAHLFVGTPQDNTDDMVSKGRWRVSHHGRPRKGHERQKKEFPTHDVRVRPSVLTNPHRRLTPEQVAEIRERRARRERAGVLAAEYGVSVRTIQNIVYGKTWA